MKAFKLIGFVFALSGCFDALAQPFLSISSKPIRSAAYYQKFVYYGAQQQHLIISTYANDSTLYRVDNYQVMSRLQVHGSEEDTLNICVRQGPTKIMYPGSRVYLTCTYNQGVLDGSLMVYYDNGAAKRRELYKRGYRKESQCYTLQGEPCACSPLFQPPQWNGNPKNLERYLTKHLGDLMEQEQLIDLYLILTINEVGQVTGTQVKSNTNTIDAKVDAAVQAVIKELPQWTPNQFNWKPALMDSVAMSDTQIIHLARRKGFITINMYSQ